jgi:hypothetical protein
MPAIVVRSGGFGDDELQKAGAIAIFDTPATSQRHWTTPLSPDATGTVMRLKRPRPYRKGALRAMTANETDPVTGTRSTRPEALAEAASDAPAGNPSQPHPTLPRGWESSLPDSGPRAFGAKDAVDRSGT